MSIVSRKRRRLPLLRTLFFILGFWHISFVCSLLFLSHITGISSCLIIFNTLFFSVVSSKSANSFCCLLIKAFCNEANLSACCLNRTSLFISSLSFFSFSSLGISSSFLGSIFFSEYFSKNSFVSGFLKSLSCFSLIYHLKIN